MKSISIGELNCHLWNIWGYSRNVVSRVFNLEIQLLSK